MYFSGLDNELLKEILSTLKEIKHLLKEDSSQNSSCHLVKKSETNNASNEQIQYGYDDETSDDVDVSVIDCPKIEMGTIEFIETDDLDDMENLKQLPLKTVAEVEWLDKEIAKIHSPYRNQIVRFYAGI